MAAICKGYKHPARGCAAQRDLQLPAAARRPDAAAMRGSRSFTRRRSDLGTTVCRLKGSKLGTATQQAHRQRAAQRYADKRETG
jgi:hypothetical protein